MTRNLAFSICGLGLGFLSVRVKGFSFEVRVYTLWFLTSHQLARIQVYW